MAFSGRKVVPDISQVLVDKAREINFTAWGSECPPADSSMEASPGAAYLRALRDEALGKIKGAQMATLISANVNGESFTKEIAIDAAAMADQANIALRELLGTEVRITYSLFSGFPH